MASMVGWQAPGHFQDLLLKSMGLSAIFVVVPRQVFKNHLYFKLIMQLQINVDSVVFEGVCGRTNIVGSALAHTAVCTAVGG